MKRYKRVKWETSERGGRKIKGGKRQAMKTEQDVPSHKTPPQADYTVAKLKYGRCVRG